MSVCSRSEMSKSDLSVKSGISVKNYINHVSVSVVEDMSKSDLGVRSGISFKNCVNVSV